MKKQLCSEVYAVVTNLGEDYIERIPPHFWNAICDGMDANTIPLIDKSKTIDEQNLSKEALAMVAMLKLRFWCDSEDEQSEYFAKLQQNEAEIIDTLSQATNTRELMKMLKK